jgi:stearoyl-CoA desaturase (delta-9 desaturase)
MQMLEAVIMHRFEVLSAFTRSLQQTIVAEVNALRQRTPGLPHRNLLAALKHLFQREYIELSKSETKALEQALRLSAVLQTIYAMRHQLISLWSRSAETPAQLLKQLEDWCQSAETSGIAALQEFSCKLRCYG